MHFLFLFLSILFSLNFIAETSLAESKIINLGNTIELKDDEDTQLSKLNIKLGCEYSKKATSAYCVKNLNAAKCWSSASVFSYQAAESIMKSYDEKQSGNELASTVWKKISQNEHLCSEYFAKAGKAFESNDKNEGEDLLKYATLLSKETDPKHKTSDTALKESKHVEQNLTQKIALPFLEKLTQY